ncbi:MAG: BrnT family toxin [Chloroflexi bacterium]|nr:MAG: BrnT family toxin [Chloroflexota bacterium]MCE7860091.1 BrnT family toxin [Chloroflexi bacterium CFX2]
MQYNFDWDPVKARRNLKKHGVSFLRAARVFLDPFAISIYDEDHSENEDRWVTIGAESNEILLVVVHTFRNVDADNTIIRIISARIADKDEAQQYHERRS